MPAVRTAVPLVPISSIRSGKPGYSAVVAISAPSAPLAKRRPAPAKSSVSMRCRPVVPVIAATSATGPARLSGRSRVWIAWVIRTPPPSRASVPRPGSS